MVNAKEIPAIPRIASTGSAKDTIAKHSPWAAARAASASTAAARSKARPILRPDSLDHRQPAGAGLTNYLQEKGEQRWHMSTAPRADPPRGFSCAACCGCYLLNRN